MQDRSDNILGIYMSTANIVNIKCLSHSAFSNVHLFLKCVHHISYEQILIEKNRFDMEYQVLCLSITCLSIATFWFFGCLELVFFALSSWLLFCSTSGFLRSLVSIFDDFITGKLDSVLSFNCSFLFSRSSWTLALLTHAGSTF